MLLWSSKAISNLAPSDLVGRAYQNDVLDWTLLDLLDISTQGEQPWNSVLSPDFQSREGSLDVKAQ
jgi:heptose-I-phosphate ethanolaminephosphotransferase